MINLALEQQHLAMARLGLTDPDAVGPPEWDESAEPRRRLYSGREGVQIRQLARARRIPACRHTCSSAPRTLAAIPRVADWKMSPSCTMYSFPCVLYLPALRTSSSVPCSLKSSKRICSAQI
jgi:hypothetical protein